MSYIDRLQDSIQMTSPNGDTYAPLWRGDNITVNKSLGRHKYPFVKGEEIQDLDVNATSYLLTLYFVGSDNDIEATEFFKSCQERGAWEIQHPVPAVGTIKVFLLSVTQKVQPVTSGNITQFDTEWVESKVDDKELSTLELSQNVEANNASLKNTLADVVLKQATTSQVVAIQTTASTIIDTFVDTTKELYSQTSESLSRVNGIISSTLSTIDEAVIDSVVLANQLITLVQYPLTVVNSLEERIDVYTNLITQTIDKIVPAEDDSPEAYNEALVTEIALVSAVTSLALINTSSILDIRKKSIFGIDTIIENFDIVTEYLDTSQEVFVEQDIDFKYFSQKESYAQTMVIVAQSIQYLTKIIFDLKIEKKFILSAPKTPIAISFEEYGLDESLLDLFISSNQLKGNEILLLPRNKEVSVYV